MKFSKGTPEKKYDIKKLIVELKTTQNLAIQLKGHKFTSDKKLSIHR